MSNIQEIMSFPNIIAETFAILENKGYELVEANQTIVRYKKGLTEIDIYLGRNSSEVGIGVSISEERFSLSEIIRLTNASLANSYRNPIARDAQNTKTAAEQLRRILLDFAPPDLEFDSDFHSLIKDQRRSWALAYAAEGLTQRTRPLADQAFKDRDFPRVVELLSQIEDHLTSSQRKMLEIAKRRIVPTI